MNLTSSFTWFQGPLPSYRGNASIDAYTLFAGSYKLSILQVRPDSVYDRGANISNWVDSNLAILQGAGLARFSPFITALANSPLPVLAGALGDQARYNYVAQHGDDWDRRATLADLQIKWERTLFGAATGFLMAGPAGAMAGLGVGSATSDIFGDIANTTQAQMIEARVIRNLVREGAHGSSDELAQAAYEQWRQENPTNNERWSQTNQNAYLSAFLRELRPGDIDEPDMVPPQQPAPLNPLTQAGLQQLYTDTYGVEADARTQQADGSVEFLPYFTQFGTSLDYTTQTPGPLAPIGAQSETPFFALYNLSGLATDRPAPDALRSYEVATPFAAARRKRHRTQQCIVPPRKFSLATSAKRGDRNFFCIELVKARRNGNACHWATGQMQN